MKEETHRTRYGKKRLVKVGWESCVDDSAFNGFYSCADHDKQTTEGYHCNAGQPKPAEAA